MKSKYSQIKNMDQLDAAIKDIDSDLVIKGYEVKSKYFLAKDSYTPTSIIASGIHRISNAIPFDMYLLKLLGHLKDRLLK